MRILTPAGTAGVAVVAVTRDEMQAAGAELVLPSGGTWQVANSAVTLARLVVRGQVLDEVLAVPRGDVVELHPHGSPAVLEVLRATFLCQESVSSPAAELLRDAMSPEQFDLAAEQLGYDFEIELARLERLPLDQRDRARQLARERSRVALAHCVPGRVVLIGAQNAGKSALFNRLLLRARALAGPVAGLTRDPIHERTVLAGYPYELVDTAGECGEGEAASVDARAIAVGRALRAGALTILVVDGSAGGLAFDRELAAKASLVVANKADLGDAEWPSWLPCHARISAVQQDAAHLRGVIGGLLRALRNLPPAGPVGGVAALRASDMDRL